MWIDLERIISHSYSNYSYFPKLFVFKTQPYPLGPGIPTPLLSLFIPSFLQIFLGFRLGLIFFWRFSPGIKNVNILSNCVPALNSQNGTIRNIQTFIQMMKVKVAALKRSWRASSESSCMPWWKNPKPFKTRTRFLASRLVYFRWKHSPSIIQAGFQRT